MSKNEYSEISKKRLSTCHPLLKYLFEGLLKDYDHSILCGHRNEIEQDSAVSLGNSKVNFPDSKHNSVPSMAVDVAPYFKWVGLYHRPNCYVFAGKVIERARSEGIPLRWGGDWNSDGNTKDNRFNDLVHYELDCSIEQADRIWHFISYNGCWTGWVDVDFISGKDMLHNIS